MTTHTAPRSRRTWVLTVAILLALLCAAGSQAQSIRGADWAPPDAPLDNTPPTASFTIDPPAGYVGTYFFTDDSGSDDLEDGLRYLTARYDWETTATTTQTGSVLPSNEPTTTTRQVSRPSA